MEYEASKKVLEKYVLTKMKYVTMNNKEKKDAQIKYAEKELLINLDKLLEIFLDIQANLGVSTLLESIKSALALACTAENMHTKLMPEGKA